MSKNQKNFQEPTTVDQTTGRVYGHEITIESDLFKLKLSTCNKNVAIQDSGQVDLEKVEHIHFWRTVDSDGKKQTYCAPVAGHFHEIKFKDNGKNEPVEILSVSGPLKMGLTKVRGQIKTVPVPLHEDLEDNHTHEVEYLKSHKVQARAMNVKAIQMIGDEANKTTGVPGVIG